MDCARDSYPDKVTTRNGLDLGILQSSTRKVLIQSGEADSPMSQDRTDRCWGKSESVLSQLLCAARSSGRMFESIVRQ